MTRRKVTLDSLLRRHKPSSRPVRRWLWRHGTIATWLLNAPTRPAADDER